MPSKRNTLVLFLIVLGLAAAMAVFIQERRIRVPDLNMPGVRVFTQPVNLSPFELHDHNGKVFNRERLEGRWSLMFFGYTHCPDVCPATLALMNMVTARLPAALKNTQFVFVSVDPYRDTQAVLKAFIDHFNPSFIGVTGSKTAIDQLAEETGGIYDYEDAETQELIRDPSTLDPDKAYVVSHFAGLMVIDPQARLLAHILPPHNPDRVIEVLSRLREQE
jgi:protein SCO1/2